MSDLATIKEIAEGKDFDLRFNKTNVYKGFEGTNEEVLLFSYSTNNNVPQSRIVQGLLHGSTGLLS